MKRLILLLMLLVVLANPVQAQEPKAVQATLDTGLSHVTIGNLLVSETFDNNTAYEAFADEASNLRVQDGQYRMDIMEPNWIVWESIQTSYDDVVIEMDMSFVNSADADASAGILCRTQTYLDPQGYYFEVTPYGRYLISRSNADSFDIIAEGDHATAIQQTNHLTAVCVGDYLAFYANGQLLTEIVDASFSAGFPSWTASLYDGAIPVTVDVDNVSVWSATEATETAMQLPQADLTQGAVDIEIVRHMLDEGFDHFDSWLLYEDEGVFFRVEDGTYVAHVNSDQAAWVNNGELMRNSIIEVDIQQLAGSEINTMGVICRSRIDENGYRFWIGGDGLYNINLWHNGVLTELVPDAQPVSIQQTNILTAVCLDSYLALYINGDLIAEAKDETHAQGVTGILSSIVGEKQYVDAQFDNLNIWLVRERAS